MLKKIQEKLGPGLLYAASAAALVRIFPEKLEERFSSIYLIFLTYLS